jgi:hypothetical protein
MMEKNGNTLAPGDLVSRRDRGTKQASANESGEVLDVDTDKQLVRVKWAHSDAWVDFSTLEKL